MLALFAPKIHSTLTVKPIIQPPTRFLFLFHGETEIEGQGEALDVGCKAGKAKKNWQADDEK